MAGETAGGIGTTRPDPIDFGLNRSNQDYWTDYYRNLMLTNPKQASIKMDCEPLSLLANIANLKPVRTVSLAELGECYQRDKEGEITPETLRNVKTWWNLFCEIVKVKNIADLNHDIFKNYRAEIHRRQKKGKFAAEWVRNRFCAVKTTISHALTELELSNSDRRNLDHAALLKLPRKKKLPP